MSTTQNATPENPSSENPTPESTVPVHRSPILSRRGAVAAAGPDLGVAWHYGDPTAEQRALSRGAGVVDLSTYGVVTVTGPDRLTWLHTILSQSLTDLAPRTSTEALILDPQGRIEHAMGIVDDGTTTWLITEGANAPDLTAWLDKMRFMMRVEVADVTDDWAAIGEPVRAEGAEDEPVTWSDPWPTTASGGTRYGPPDAEHPGAFRKWRIVLVPRTELADQIRRREESGWMLAGTWAAEALRVEAWRPRLARDVDARTVPHELDWLRTAVHLDKGCYRGQESIARIHNLGRPPRRFTFLHLDGSGHMTPKAGAEVKLGERVAGTITTIAQHHELGPVALAVLRRSTDPEAELLVECEGGDISANQETIVTPDGVSTDRPAPRGPVARGIAPTRPAL